MVQEHLKSDPQHQTSVKRCTEQESRYSRVTFVVPQDQANVRFQKLREYESSVEREYRAESQGDSEVIKMVEIAAAWPCWHGDVWEETSISTSESKPQSMGF